MYNSAMSYQSLEEALQAAGSPVELLRNSQIGPYAFPVVRHEFTNWRDEQRSWRETCALFDQSHHMTDLYVEGPDALKLFSDLGVNTFKNFKVNQAKQFVACNHDGYVIGDAILFYLDENRFNLVGRPPAANWVQYNLETGGYNATAQRDERSAANQGRRKTFRYQVRAPTPPSHGEGDRQARSGYPVLQHGRLNIAGRDVRALRHGMVGQPGMGTVRSLGARRGRAGRHCGGRSGVRDPAGGRENVSHHVPRIGMDSVPLPAIYTGDEMKGYRQWLKPEKLRGHGVAGGQFLFR